MRFAVAQTSVLSNPLTYLLLPDRIVDYGLRALVSSYANRPPEARLNRLPSTRAWFRVPVRSPFGDEYGGWGRALRGPYIYKHLHSPTQSTFAWDQWLQENRWFASNGSWSTAYSSRAGWAVPAGQSSRYL